MTFVVGSALYGAGRNDSGAFQSSTGPMEWQTRVVMRSRTGTLNFSESSNARMVRS